MPSCFPGHTRIPFPKIIVKNNAHTHCPYSPEQLAIIGQAGLLTCSGFAAFPSPGGKSDHKNAKPFLKNIQLRVQYRILTGFPIQLIPPCEDESP